MSFVHLTGYSTFTPLGSLISVDEIVKEAKENGMNAVGLTDDNNLYGLFKFYKAAKKSGIKPIIGVTLNVSLKDHTIHEDNPAYKIHLLVKNEEGYHHLNQLITLAQTDGKENGDSDSIPKVYYKEVLQRTNGLVCMTGGYDGLWNSILKKQSTIVGTEWENMLLEFHQAFQDDFYIEIQDHSVSSELEVNVELLKLHKSHNIKLVLTHNYLYKTPQQSFAKEVINAIKTGRNVARDLREYVFENFETMDFATDVKFKDFLEHGNQFYFKSSEEMESHGLLKFFPELISNIQEIVGKCNLELNLDNPEMPDYPLPEGFPTEESFFRHLSEEGLKKRLPFIIEHRDVKRFPTEQSVLDAYNERLNYELDMICKMGFPGYFLVVWDVCTFARNEGIYMAPGRGSVAGSLVSYALEITGIDPIAKDLLFERFLNPARVSMPDIDLDFDSLFRSKILEYTYNKYGYDYVAQIISFNTLSAKPAVADTAKVLQLSDDKVVNSPKYNAFSDYIKKFLSPKLTISKSLKAEDELLKLYETNKTVRFLLDIAQTIEGSIKGTSMHAGGVVIGKSIISKYVPSQKAKAKEAKDDIDSYTSIDVNSEENTILEGVVIQADKKACEPMGLIKMDYLATAILSKVRITLAHINKKRKKAGLEPIHFYDLCNKVQYLTAKDDPKTYEILQQGNSLMVFQCENPALGNVLTQFYPESFEDVTAILALYRPGPMANIPQFIEGKNYPENIDYMHDDLKTTLTETNGIIVYQEQIMQLVQDWAGFSLAEADLIRRAIGSKDPEVLKEEGEKFVNQAIALGRDKALSEHIYSLVVKFADYGFNKSHAASYAVLALVTAWLKAYYPLEYTSMNINSFSNANNKPIEKISNYISNMQDMGFETLPPSINDSEYIFTEEENRLRHGLFAIKDTQEKSLLNMVRERKVNGNYDSLESLIVRNIKVYDDEEKKEGYRVEQPDRATIESLLVVGALDGIIKNKKSEILPQIDSMIKFYKKTVTDKEKRSRDAQLDLFAEMEEAFEELTPNFNIPQVAEDFDWKEILAYESKKLRFSYHTDFLSHVKPIEEVLTYRDAFDELSYKHTPKGNKEHLYTHEGNLVCYGTIRAKREINTRSGKMCFITFRDHTGIIETTMFVNEYQKHKFFLDENENSLLVFSGTLQRTVYGKIGHESKVYNFNIEDIYTLENVLNNPTLLSKFNPSQPRGPVSMGNQDNYQSNTYEVKKDAKLSLREVQEIYNIAHLKLGSDNDLKTQLLNYFKEKNHHDKDTKIIIHNYADNQIKTNVVFADKFNLSLEDIQDLINRGILNKRNVFISKKPA